MTTLTIQLPDSAYEMLQSAAKVAGKSLQQFVSDRLSFIADEMPVGWQDDLDDMTLLTDAELWQSARATLSARDVARFTALMDKYQSDNLSHRERMESERLVARYNRLNLVRAKAAALLHDRGHNLKDFYVTS